MMNQSTMYDLLIHSGTIVDGTGSPGFHGAVAVRNGVVEILRGVVDDVAARDRIDATGLVVAPGFIDVHSHSDLQLFASPSLAAKTRQGITTEVIGVDGLSLAPFSSDEDLHEYARTYAGLAGALDPDQSWRGVGDLLDRYDRNVAPNVATFVGNSALRIAVMGWETGAPSLSQMADMRAVLRQAMDEGALGLSTGLDYAPGSHAGTDELIELSRETAKLGGIYHTHVRYESGDMYLDPFEEALRIGRESGCAIHITHFSRSARGPYRRGAQPMLDLLADEVERGFDVTFDTYASQWGGTRLPRLLPKWLDAGGRTRMLEQLADPETRARVVKEVANGGAIKRYKTSRPFADVRLGNLDHPDYTQYETRYLSEVAVDMQRDVVDVIVDLVIGNAGATFTRPSPDPATLWKFIAHPLGMISSDSVLIGKASSPRAYGCYPQILEDYVREEGLLPLHDAIRKMTSFPAQRLGITDRGVLRNGFKADVVVFDPDAVSALATYEEPMLHPTGIPHVIVNGEFVVRDGCTTGATPGRAIRDAPARVR